MPVIDGIFSLMKNVALFIGAFLALLVIGCDSSDDKAPKVAPVENTSSESDAAAETVSTPTEAEQSSSTASGTDTVSQEGDGDGNYEAWFKKHQLNLDDPGMLDADPDGDGFSNRDEFLADTDPTSGESRPGFHRNLRLKEYKEVKVPLVLQSIENNRAKIQRADESGSSVETVKQGDTIRGTGLKVSKIRRKKEVDKNGVEIDTSEVIAENSASGEKVILVKDLSPRSSESYAVLGTADGSETVKVKQGEKFQWPGEADKTYRVIDLRPTQVVVEQIESGKTFTIPKAE